MGRRAQAWVHGYMDKSTGTRARAWVRRVRVQNGPGTRGYLPQKLRPARLISVPVYPFTRVYPNSDTGTPGSRQGQTGHRLPLTGVSKPLALLLQCSNCQTSQTGKFADAPLYFEENEHECAFFLHFVLELLDQVIKFCS